MKLKALIMDENAVRRSLTRISHEIEEKNEGNEVFLIGVRRRGVPLAKKIAENIGKIYGKAPETGELESGAVKFAEIDILGAANLTSFFTETTFQSKTICRK